MSERIYIPKAYAKEISGRYGKFLSISFNAEALIAFIQQNTNAKGGIKFNVSPRREVDQYGNSHSVSLDNYVPDGARRQEQAPKSEPSDSDEPVPF